MATQLETTFPRSLAVWGAPLIRFWTRGENSSVVLLNYSFSATYVNLLIDV